MQLCLLCRILNTWGLLSQHFHHVSSRLSVKPARASGTAIIDLQRHKFFQASRRFLSTSTQRLGAGDRRIKKNSDTRGLDIDICPRSILGGCTICSLTVNKKVALVAWPSCRQRHGHLHGRTDLSFAAQSPLWHDCLVVNDITAFMAQPPLSSATWLPPWLKAASLVWPTMHGFVTFEF